MLKFFKFIDKCILIFIILFLLNNYVFMSTAHRSRPAAKKKACVSNMKTIEGAAELYVMENGSPEKINALYKIPENAAAVLANEGYLRVQPRCPGNGFYMVFQKFDEKRNIISDVSCSVHGDLLKQETEHRELGL